MIFGGFMLEKKIPGIKSTQIMFVVILEASPINTLGSFLSELKIFENFEIFVIKCLKKGQIHTCQNLNIFEKRKRAILKSP